MAFVFEDEPKSRFVFEDEPAKPAKKSLGQRVMDFAARNYGDTPAVGVEMAGTPGGAEGTASAATGLFSWIPAGLSMFAPESDVVPGTLLPPQQSPVTLKQRAERANMIQSALTYEPPSEEGKRVAAAYASPFTEMAGAGNYSRDQWYQWADEAERKGDKKRAAVYRAAGLTAGVGGEALPFLLPYAGKAGVRGLKNAVPSDMNIFRPGETATLRPGPVPVDTEAPAPRFEFESDAFDMTRPFERGEIDFTAPEAKVRAESPYPDYREVGPDEALQPGAEVKMDMATGKNYVKDTPVSANAEKPAPAKAKEPWRENPYTKEGKVEEVPISWLERFKEHDRRKTPKYGPEDKTLDEVKADIAVNGIKEPLPLTIGIEDGTALLSEGNTRLAAAKELGYTHVPVRVVRYNNAMGVAVEMPGIKTLEAQNKHINADLSPGEVFGPEVLADYPELAKAGEAAVATPKADLPNPTRPPEVGGRGGKPAPATLFSGVDPTLIIDKIANSKTGRAVIEFFDPGATIPKGNEWLIDRQAAKGGIARGETLAEKFVKTFKHLTEDERQQIWEFMDGRKPLSDLPANLQHPARRMRMIDNVVGKRLADEGVISAETYEANKGNHIRYIYNVYQQGQELMGGGGAKINRAAFSERHDWGQAATKKHLNDNFGYLPKQERGALHGFLDGVVDKADLPDHIKWIADQLVEKKAEFKDVEQSRMGLIKDPIQAMAQSITEGEKATAMSKYFKKIAGTPEWIFEPSVLKINGLKMGIGKAQSLVDAMERVGELNPEQIRFKAQLEGAIQGATAKMGKPPGDFIQLNGKNYGALDGMYVNKTIAQDIKPVFALGNESSSSLVNSIKSGSIVATGLWKMKNVALNVPTMARNVISNNIQLLMSGMGPHKLAIRIPEAILSLAKRDQDWRALMRQGAFKTNFATAELAELVEIAKTIKDAPNILELVSRMQRLGKFYGKIDDVFKLAKFKDLRGKGVETAEAARQSIRWGMDYSLAHPSIKALRSLPLGSPFITYQYKIAPLIVQSIKERPWVIGSIMALPYIVQKAVTSDMTDEDARQYIKSLPEYVKNGQVFLIPGTHGMNALDVSYMVPWGNWYQVLNSAASGKPTKAMKELGVSQGLIPTLIYASITGKDLFTGEEIVDPLERHDPRAAAWALTKYIWQVAMPPMLGEYGVAGKVAAHVQHGQTKQGMKTEGMNVWPRIGGANIYPVDPTGGTRQKAGEISEVRKALIRRMNDRNLEVEERKALIMLYRQSVSDIQEKYN